MRGRPLLLCPVYQIVKSNITRAGGRHLPSGAAMRLPISPQGQVGTRLSLQSNCSSHIGGVECTLSVWGPKHPLSAAEGPY